MKTPEEYKNILSSAYKSFNLSLEEIVHSYPLYKLYPDNSLHKREYNKDMQNLERIKSNLFTNKNNLHRDSETITHNIAKTNDKIEELNKSNSRLTKKLHSLENLNSGASGELIDRKFIYNINFSQNLILVAIITGCSGLLYYKETN